MGVARVGTCMHASTEADGWLTGPLEWGIHMHGGSRDLEGQPQVHRQANAPTTGGGTDQDPDQEAKGSRAQPRACAELPRKPVRTEPTSATDDTTPNGGEPSRVKRGGIHWPFSWFTDPTIEFPDSACPDSADRSTLRTIGDKGEPMDSTIWPLMTSGGE